MAKRLLVLGSTGSIGENTLAVARNIPDELEIVGLAARSNWRAILDQTREFRPTAVALSDEAAASELEDALRGSSSKQRIYAGDDAFVRLVEESNADIVVGAVSGAAGLPATLAAVESGKDLALANKEALVMAGSILTRRARELDRRILPVDSEHSAIFQSLQAGRPNEVERVILTASGGPFRSASKAELETVTPAEALRHPTWDMGPKITIDSATLMNKALEIIEAFWLFGLPPEKIDVVVHPQSIIHSLAEFVDGSTICQLGLPDMKVPIQYALTFPSRRHLPGPRLNLPDVAQLTFEAPDFERFPSLRLAYDALRHGGTASTVLNAANEVAVELFLKGRLSFLRIFEMIEMTLRSHKVIQDPTLEEIFGADRWARETARTLGEQQTA